MSESTKLDKKLLDTLAKLGGGKFQESDVEFEGQKFLLPVRYRNRLGEAIEVLRKIEKAQDEVYEFSRSYRFRPWDGAAATHRAVQKLTGMSGLGRGMVTFFGSITPSMRTINVDVGETLQVPWGQLEVPLFDGTIGIGYTEHQEYGMLFHLSVTCPKKHRFAVEGFFNMVQDELETGSIYRGKVFDGQEMPEFIDLSGVDPAKVVYSDEVQAQLEANLWSMIRDTDVLRTHEVPLKRAVLLHGPYGTGKTLAAYLTAIEARRHGWTFVYCRPGIDDLETTLMTARLYQPSVVFFEDIDSVAEGKEGGDSFVTRLLDMIDGIQAKGTELLVVLTTNHPERIHKGLVRPGRLDAVVEIADLDVAGIARMIESIVPDEMRDDLDYEAIGASMEGFLPAFVREAIDRTKRYAIARTGAVEKLGTPDFVHAADGLRPQLEMMEGAKEGKTDRSLDQQIDAIVKGAMDRSELLDGDRVFGSIRTNHR